MFLEYNRNLKPKARQLRKSMTEEEKKLWYCFLRDYPVRVLRQRPIAEYILDFYCPEAKLGIEIDGCYHFTEREKTMTKSVLRLLAL